MISIDSSGWVERLTGGPKSATYNRVIDAVRASEIVTSVVTIFEVYKRVKSAHGELAALEDVAAIGQTRVVPFDHELALEAADFSLSNGLHFADSIVYATAQRFRATLYTSDIDLAKSPGVVLV
ncbi:MAG: type II toxin-antitoxin system VapC family toxin [Thermoplasmata archaeon]